MGKIACNDLEFSSDFATVETWLRETKEVFDLINLGLVLSFGGIKNVTEYVSLSLLGGILPENNFLAILGSAEASSRLRNFIMNKEDKPLLQNYAMQLIPLPKLVSSIERTISEHGLVRDDASSELRKIRNSIIINKSRVKDKLESILRSSEYQKYFQEQIVTMRSERYVIPIKQEYRQYFPGIVHDQSGSGATIFIEPMAVVNLNNEIKKLIADEKNEVERILKQLTKDIALFSEELLINQKIFTALDVINAKAEYAIKTKSTMPNINSNNYLQLKKARHPLIDQQIVVPIDIEFGDTFNTLLITGPNTGGKTVTLKIVGLFAMMTQTGLFLPIEIDGTMPIFSNIFADIGDEQSIEQSLSTFSSHMTNIIHILTNAPANSLVLLDEICAGTDPAEGAALSMAILQYLEQKNVNTIITTHYSELKTFAYNRPKMKNASVEFDSNSLRPTYRLLMGIAGSSNALSISRRLGLAETIIDSANTFLSEEHKSMTKMLGELEEERKVFAQQRQDAEELRKTYLRLKSDIVKQKNSLEQNKITILNKAREQAQELIKSAKRDADDIISTLKNTDKNVDSKTKQAAIEQARKALGQINFAGEDENMVDAVPLNLAETKVGMVVYVEPLKKNGLITKISKDDLSIEVGILKTTVKANQCFIIAKNSYKNTATLPEKKTRTLSSSNLRTLKNVKKEIDLRGMIVDDAINELEKYIDDAVLSNISPVVIIHGMGTGALKKGLLIYLESHISVKQIEAAPQNMGGNGATILHLK